jgi:apolipoprotein N-acyltransferase
MPEYFTITILFIGFVVISFERKTRFNYLWRVLVLFLAFFLLSLTHYSWIDSFSLKAFLGTILVSTVLTSFPFISSLVFKFRYIQATWIISSWLGIEFFHTHHELGFPWFMLGNIFGRWPELIQWYEITGVLGGSLWLLSLTFLSSLIIRKLLTRKPIKQSLISFIVVAVFPIIFSFILLFHHSSISSETKLPVALVHTCYEGKTNISQALTEIEKNLQKDSLQEGLVVFPELAMPDDIWLVKGWQNQNLKILQRFITSYPNMQVLIGTHILLPHPGGKHNSKLINQPFHKFSGACYFDDAISDSMKFIAKNKFIPFQERIPDYLDFISYPSMNYSYANNELSKINMSPEKTVGVIICYESLFGEYIAKKKSVSSRVLFQLSSELFFHNPKNKRQYLHINRLRAIEARSYLVRVTNCGISGMISPTGDIKNTTKKSGAYEITHLLVPLINKLTIYEAWGDWLGRIAIGLMMIILCIKCSSIFTTFYTKG